MNSPLTKCLANTIDKCIIITFSIHTCLYLKIVVQSSRLCPYGLLPWISLLKTVFPKNIWIHHWLTKTFVQNLYKMYRKIIQNTKFAYILYTKIVQIKILYDNYCIYKKCTSHFYIYLYKKCTNCTQLVQKFRPKMAWTWNMFFVHTNNA